MPAAANPKTIKERCTINRRILISLRADLDKNGKKMDVVNCGDSKKMLLGRSLCCVVFTNFK
jgi:hypothetical protein